MFVCYDRWLTVDQAGVVMGFREWVSGDEPIAVERGWKVVIESPIVLSTKQHENRNDIDN